MIDTKQLARESAIAKHRWDSAVSWLKEDAEELMPAVIEMVARADYTPLGAAVALIAAKEAHGG